MKNERLKKLFSAFIVIGIVGVLGTAGASDLNTIGFTQIVTQTLASLFMIGLGVRGLTVGGKYER